MKKYDLNDRVPAITGGGRGIGLACAEALAEAGARIVLLERDEAVATEGAETLRRREQTSIGSALTSLILTP